MSPRLIRILEILKSSNESIKATLILARRNVAASAMQTAQSVEFSGAVSRQGMSSTNRMNFDYSN